ncbi:hypothetical protein KAR91_41220 [Candidatus Pacearchaeota archaeon]|nr:hypothetical protein [Candidatus Pacearchaeota archaeon]
MEDTIKLKCISKFPFIEEMGLGKFETGKEHDIPVSLSERFLKNGEWENVKIKVKSKKEEVKHA